MVKDINITAPENPTEPALKPEQKFNWRHCWYPITFVQDFPTNRPYSFSLYDEPLVLFPNEKGEFVCLTDLCPHRAAKLSDGQIIDGKIECLYHGWQFGTDGECLHIPQLPEAAKIPQTACVKSFKIVERQGIIWMWAGEAVVADEKLIPTVADLDKPGLICIDTVVDLPYDQTYLVENFVDPAHVFISHDRTELAVKREDSQPLEMEVSSVSAQGIKGRYRRTRNPNALWADMEFIAPHLVTYKLPSIPGLVGGFGLYALPLGKGRCRVFVRRYGNYFKWSFKLQPRWLEHMRQNKVLEEDLPFIVGQEEYINKSGKSLKEAFLPLKTSDLFVIEYRKWLDKFGDGLPFYQGYATAKCNHSNQLVKMSVDRLSRHTQICSSCSRAYQVTIQLKQTCVGIAIALVFIAILTDGKIKIAAVSTSILAGILLFVAQQIKIKFERPYRRYD